MLFSFEILNIKLFFTKHSIVIFYNHFLIVYQHEKLLIYSMGYTSMLIYVKTKYTVI